MFMNLKEINPVKTLKETEKAVREKILTLILAGFGLVAALAWNEAIQSLFQIFFPEKEGLIGKFLYAVLVTVIVVILSLSLKKLEEKENG